MSAPPIGVTNNMPKTAATPIKIKKVIEAVVSDGKDQVSKKFGVVVYDVKENIVEPVKEVEPVKKTTVKKTEPVKAAAPKVQEPVVYVVEG